MGTYIMQPAERYETSMTAHLRTPGRTFPGSGQATGASVREGAALEYELALEGEVYLLRRHNQGTDEILYDGEVFSWESKATGARHEFVRRGNVFRIGVATGGSGEPLVSVNKNGEAVDVKVTGPTTADSTVASIRESWPGVAVFVAGVAATLLGYYVGLKLLVPTVGAVLVFAGLRKLRPDRGFDAAVALQGWQLSWVVLGLSWVDGTPTAIVGIALFTVALSLLALALRPSISAIAMLLLFHLGATTVHIVRLLDLGFGEQLHQAHSVHLFLSLLSVGALVSGYFQWREPRPDATPRSVSPAGGIPSVRRSTKKCRSG